jgi:hypothetical protein
VAVALQRIMSVRNNRRPPGQQLAGTLNGTMSVAYLFCGSFLLISPSAGKIMPAEYLHFVGGALVVYGLFRAYRSYHQFFSKKPFS